jgi:hypothetical protein
MRIAGLLAVVGAVLCLGVVSERCQQGTTPRLVRIVDLHQQLTDAERRKLEYLIAPLIFFHRSHAYIPTPFPLYVRLFPKKTDFLAYQSKLSKSPISSKGVFFYRRNEIIVNTAYEDFPATIVHEAQHAIFHYSLKKPPKWLNEGLSEVCETFYLDGLKIRGKAQTQKWDRVRGWIATHQSISLRNLLLISTSQWNRLSKEQENVAYTLSWAVVYYLLSDASRRNLLLHIIRDHHNGGGTSVAIIERRYPGGLAGLERDVVDYFR